MVERIAVVCSACNSPTACQVAGSFVDPEDDAMFSLVRCEHCGAIMLAVQEPIDTDEGVRLGSAGPVWPSRDHLPPDYRIPTSPRQAFQEARVCLRAGAHVAAAAMVRRTLEAVCHDKGAKGRTLYEQLDSLGSQNVIEGRLIEWAHQLRTLGNDAAHASNVSVSPQDAQDSVELAEALLDYVYVFAARYDAFRARRNPAPLTHPWVAAGA